MKKRIIVTACLLSLISSSAFSGSPYSKKKDKDETRPYKQNLPYHMKLYEQAEEEAQNQYSTIVDTPETESSKQEQDPEEGGAPYPARNDADETRPYKQNIPSHLMLYQQAEEEAENQYSTIVDIPETENPKQEQDTGEEGKTKDITE